jgi:hypothetical protein
MTTDTNYWLGHTIDKLKNTHIELNCLCAYDAHFNIHYGKEFRNEFQRSCPGSCLGFLVHAVTKNKYKFNPGVVKRQWDANFVVTVSAGMFCQTSLFCFDF